MYTDPKNMDGLYVCVSKVGCDYEVMYRAGLSFYTSAVVCV